MLGIKANSAVSRECRVIAASQAEVRQTIGAARSLKDLLRATRIGRLGAKQARLL